MGVKLFVEVLDHWQDYGLTAGERSDLLVIAENANDGSRTTWGPMHESYILKRAGKTAAGWRNAIGKLMKKGVLGYAVRDGRELSGFPGQHAVYRIPVLCPDAPHDGLRGQCTRPTAERVTSQVTQSDDDSTTGHPTGDPISGTGHLTGAERVTSQVTPTPPIPSITTPPPPVAEVPKQPSAENEQGGGGGDASPATEEQQRAADFVDSLRYDGQRPDGRQRPRLVKLVAAAFAAGWVESTLRLQIDPGDAKVDSRLAIYLHRLNRLPEQAPRVVAAVPDAEEARPTKGRCSECRNPIWLDPDAGDTLCKACREALNPVAPEPDPGSEAKDAFRKAREDALRTWKERQATAALDGLTR